MCCEVTDGVLSNKSFGKDLLKSMVHTALGNVYTVRLQGIILYTYQILTAAAACQLHCEIHQLFRVHNRFITVSQTKHM